MMSEGRVLMKEKQYVAAREKLEKCIRRAPGYPDCHKNLGTVWAQLKEPQKGAAEYRRFLELAGPEHPSYGKVREILDSYEHAR